jgi:hypothetical protein
MTEQVEQETLTVLFTHDLMLLFFGVARFDEAAIWCANIRELYT